MLAKSSKTLPLGDFCYEPKWDGFRCIVFRAGEQLELGSRNGKSLTRYFPELVEALRGALPPRCVVDGEIVVVGEHGLDFDALSERIHPAESRVRRLAAERPASYVAFDLLALGEEDLRRRRFEERRRMLGEMLASAQPPVHLTPLTRDPELAVQWFERFEGAGLDGVVAKEAAGPYLEGQRAMWKLKHERSADFVVGGFRWYRAQGEAVGSLLLGLYDGGDLRHVGVIGAFSAPERHALVAKLSPYRDPDAHPWSSPSTSSTCSPERPGAPSRWNGGKDLGFEALRPELVVEATYEHMQGRRLRHTARFKRWRPDRDAPSCGYEQLEVAVPAVLSEVFAAGTGRERR